MLLLHQKFSSQQLCSVFKFKSGIVLCNAKLSNWHIALLFMQDVYYLEMGVEC